MQVDISFEFAKVFNIDRFVHVVLGQKFTLFTDTTAAISFFSDNDPVLALSASPGSVDIEATALGASTVLMMDENRTIIKTLDFIVVTEIIEPANQLGVSADAAEPK